MKNIMYQDPIYKLTEEIALELSKKAEMTDTLDQIKAADGEEVGTFDVIISTGDLDRHGERIDPKGIDFTHFKENPVVLFGHEHRDLPVGRADEVGVETVDGKEVVRAKGRFAPEDANPKAQQVRKLHDAEIMNTTSVGIIVHEIQIGDGDDEKTLERKELLDEGILKVTEHGEGISKDVLKEKGLLTKDNDIITITKSELLEFSFVPVPANPFATAIRENGLDVRELTTKGLVFAAQDEPQEPQETDEPKDEPAPETDPENAGEGKNTEETNKDTEKENTQDKGPLRDQIEQPKDPVEQKINKMEDVFDVINALIDVYVFNDDVPVDDFQKLVAEAAQMLAEIANGETDGKSQEGVIRDALTGENARDVLSAYLILRTARSKQDPDDPNAPEAVKKAGAIFNDLNETVNDEMVKTSRKVLRLIGNALEGNDKAKENGDENGDGNDNHESTESTDTNPAPDNDAGGDNESGASTADEPGGDAGEDSAEAGRPNERSINPEGVGDFGDAKTYFEVRDTLRLASTALSDALSVVNRHKPPRKSAKK